MTFCCVKIKTLAHQLIGINAVDHGGLIHINNMTFELFLSMEHNIHGCVKAGQELGDIRYRLKDNEEV